MPGTVLPLLKELSVEGAATKSLCLKHIEEEMVFCSAVEDVYQMIRGADCYVKSQENPSQFQSVSFYRLSHQFFRRCNSLSSRKENTLVLVGCISESRRSEVGDKEHYNQDKVYQ